LSLIKSILHQLGLSVTPANNFTLDAAADNGTMKLARGNAGATTQDIMTVNAAGKVAFPQNLNVFMQAQSAQGSVGTAAFTPLSGWTIADSLNGGTINGTGQWTPPVAGWYQINFFTAYSSVGITASQNYTQLRKNGALVASAGSGANSLIFPVSRGSWLVYLNGTTDNIDVGAYHNAGVVVGSVTNGFNGALVVRN